MKPTGNYLYVQRMPSVRHGKILLPPTDINSSDVLKFKVTAVGPGRISKRGVRIPPEIAEGDIVLWKSYTGAPVEIEKDLYCVRASDIIAVLETTPPGADQPPLLVAQLP